MPIRAELRHHYSGSAWLLTRQSILTRAGHKCEWCRKPNRKEVTQRTWHGRMWWRTASLWRDHTGKRVLFPMNAMYRETVVEVVLTIAHLNQTAGDDRPENLAALCQWCHLKHDRQQHLRSAKETRLNRKDRSRPLLVEAS